MMGCYPLVGYIVKGVERFYELFCLFCAQFFFFFGDDSKAINFGTSNSFAAGSHVAAGLPNQTAVFQCAKCFIVTDNLSVLRLFFFSSDREKVREYRDSFVEEEERRSLDIFRAFFRQKLKDGSINDDSDRQSYFILLLSVNVWRRKIRGARRRVVKWRPRGCLGVRLERVNRKLKPFKCKGEETVIYVSFIVCYDLNKPFLSITLEKTTRVFYELQQRAVCNSLYFYNSLYCSNFVK